MIYVRDQLGHSSMRITVDTYGHLVQGGNKEAVDKLDDNVYYLYYKFILLFYPFYTIVQTKFITILSFTHYCFITFTHKEF